MPSFRPPMYSFPLQKSLACPHFGRQSNPFHCRSLSHALISAANVFLPIAEVSRMPSFRPPIYSFPLQKSLACPHFGRQSIPSHCRSLSHALISAANLFLPIAEVSRMPSFRPPIYSFPLHSSLLRITIQHTSEPVCKSFLLLRQMCKTHLLKTVWFVNEKVAVHKNNSVLLLNSDNGVQLKSILYFQMYKK